MGAPPKKPHVSLQTCAACAYSRPRDPGAHSGIECRWDGPPWTDKAVRPDAWCRRWAMRPPPLSAPKTTAPTSAPHDTEAKGS